MASLPIRYHPEASQELSEALDWYAQRDPRVADRFGRLYLKKLNEAAKTPRRWAKHRDGTRLILLPRFPYQLIVREKSGVLDLIAVAHTSRRPGYWRHRLK
jgi:plasmid stabilization system protein ParE